MKKCFTLDPKNPPTLSYEQKLRLETPESSAPEEDNPVLSAEDYEKISKVLFVKKVREELGLTQSDFGKVFHITPSRLRDWEQGRRKPDEAMLAYLKVIREQPEDVKKILSD